MRTALAGIALALGLPGLAGAATADCGKAGGQVDELICQSQELAQLDAEQDRLFLLARDAYMRATERNKLVADQEAWTASREDCLKTADPTLCLRDSMVTHIAGLLRDYPDARYGERGISLGPFAADCPSLGAPLTATFVNSDPGAVYLAWADRTVVLDHAMSGSGARYEATVDGGNYLFWNKGNQATFKLPGVAKSLTCTLATDVE